MKPEQFARLEKLYREAVALPPERVPSFVDSHCANDPVLREELERLLAQDSVKADEFFRSVDQTVFCEPPPNHVAREGDRIGPYKLVRRIGEGGMGTVFEANQESPVRRRVAIKLIKWGMDTKEVVARFESERQALALMNHPSIAQAYDAGTTDLGRPYFAMEFVSGVPITEYCDKQRLSTTERLELFVQVCRGVQHAHQKGVIHRDLKPSNVLVTIEGDRPVPKIIDFGVAKATSHRLTEKTVFTELGQLIGTPEYMSPEQAEMSAADVDTRTDVYALGVLLYELLVGALPFAFKELRTAGFDEIRRKIREDEPLRPSARVSSLGDVSTATSWSRRISPRQLVSRLRGDLDWITMRAIEKDRTRRYGAVSDLELDIHLYLENKPVLAGPPSAWYRTQKFVRRHRAGVFMAVVLGLGLGVGIVGSAVGLLRAQREAAAAERVAGFLADILGSVDAQRLGRNLQEDLEQRAADSARDWNASEDQIQEAITTFSDVMAGINWTDAGLHLIDDDILAPAGKTIAENFGDEPTVAARLQATIGTTYVKLGLYDSAESYLLTALETREQYLGRDHAETVGSLNDYGLWLLESGKAAEAEPYLREALEARRRQEGAESPNMLAVMRNVGAALRAQGKLDEAEPYMRGALDGLTRGVGADDERTLSATNGMAELLHDQGRLDEAESYYRRALDTSREVLGNEHLRTLIAINNLAMLLQDRGDLDESELYLREAVERRREVLGQDHPMTLTAINNLALLLQGQRRYDEAEPFYEEALEGRRRVLGPDNPMTLTSVHNMGFLRKAQGRLEEAAPYYRESVLGFRRALGDDHPMTLTVIHNSGVLLQARGKLDEAEQYFREALEGRREVLGDDHYNTVRSIINLGSLLRSVGRPKEAEPYYLEALEIRRRTLGDDHPGAIRSAIELASLLVDLESLDEAESLLVEAHELVEASDDLAHSAWEPLARTFVELYEVQGRPDDVSRWQARLDAFAAD